MDLGNFRLQNILQNLLAPKSSDNWRTPPFVSPTNPNQGVISDGDLPDQDAPQINQIEKMFGSGIEPNYEMSNRIKQMIDSMPQRENPSTGRKVLGMLAGLGSGAGPATYYHGAALGFQGNPNAAVKTADLIANKPYYQKLEDWETKLKPIEQAAGIEARRNINERMLSKDLETERSHKANEKIRQQRADAYDFKTKNPDWKLVPGKGGTVHFVNPKDPSQSIDTGIEAGTLSDEDKMNLGYEQALGRIQARGEEQRKTEATKESNREKIEGIRQPNRIRLKQTVPGKAAGVSKSPAGTKAQTGAVEKSDRVAVLDPNGKEFTLPKEQVDAFLKSPQGKGYRRK